MKSVRGIVTIEFVLTFPMLIFFFFACLQIAHLCMARQVVHYAAFCAARAALVTVCDPSGPSDKNDSWPNRDELTVRGLKQTAGIAAGRGGLATSEAEYWANKAAILACAWIAMDEPSANAPLNIPGMGAIPYASMDSTKTRAILDWNPADWTVTATVEHDFPLIVPMIGPMLAWGMDVVTGSPATRGGELNALYPDRPHLRLKEAVVLSKPYHTVIAAENWRGKYGL